MLRDAIADSSPVHELEEEEIRISLARSKVDYVLVADAGFSEELIGGGAPKLRSYSIQETNIANQVILKVEGFLGAAQGIAETAGGDEDAFYAGMNSFLQGNFTVSTGLYSTNGRSVEAALSGLGQLAMAMMFLSTFTAINLIKERENRTFYRVMASPCSLRNYMLQNVLVFFSVLLCQVGVMFLSVGIFSTMLGPAVLKLFLVMAVFALLCVAMGIALATAARSVVRPALFLLWL